MRYEICDKEGNVLNTIVCDDPEFAATLGEVVVPCGDPPGAELQGPSPARRREEAYNTRPLIEWGGEMLTVTQAAQLWQYYAAEGSDKAAELQGLIAEAKAGIREEFPDDPASAFSQGEGAQGEEGMT